MHNPKPLQINEDGDVYRGKSEPYEKLGHIGSILHPMNRTNTASQVRAWWNALVASNEPVEDYVPPQDQTTNPRIRVRTTALVISSDSADEASELLETVN